MDPALLVSVGTSIGLGQRECERTVASGISAGMESLRSVVLTPQ